MPEFTYEALDKGGRQVRGVIDASSEEVIVEKLGRDPSSLLLTSAG